MATQKKDLSASVSKQTNSERIQVLKTYKVFIDGKFPRTESGRYYPLLDQQGKVIANMCLSSRKDFRNAVVAARKAQVNWASKSAFNRSQILYRMAEMLEARATQFVDELMLMGCSKSAAKQEVEQSVDLLIYYAGWADKYGQVFSSVNPVSGSYFNFSTYEPMGVAALIADGSSGLLGLVSIIAPVIVGGNSAVVLASYTKPLCAISFSEVIATSDVPAGVVNVLTGDLDELYTYFASHMDVNALVYQNVEDSLLEKMQQSAVRNLKRIKKLEAAPSPYAILACQEVKTTWHPIERIGASGSGY